MTSAEKRKHPATCRVAVVQMDSRTDITANLAQAARLIVRAAHRKARLVLLSENVLYIGPDRRQRFTLRSPEVRALATLAARHRLWLLVGSIQEAIPRSPQHYNTALLYGPDGRLRARYRKIHRFRCRLPDGRWLREATTRPGNRVVVARTSFGSLGLAICYDLRMPELFGHLTRRGAQLLAIPSNFTAHTGAAHWHTLLRARAIENQAFVFAPAQCGDKYHTPSYGHALIVDPWGKILAEAATSRPTVLVQDIDLGCVMRCRQQLPALRDRLRRSAGRL